MRHALSHPLIGQLGSGSPQPRISYHQRLGEVRVTRRDQAKAAHQSSFLKPRQDHIRLLPFTLSSPRFISLHVASAARRPRSTARLPPSKSPTNQKQSPTAIAADFRQVWYRLLILDHQSHHQCLHWASDFYRPTSAHAGRRPCFFHCATLTASTQAGCNGWSSHYRQSGQGACTSPVVSVPVPFSLITPSTCWLSVGIISTQEPTR